MRLKLTSAAIPGWFAVALSLLLLAGGHAYAQASDLKLEVQLIWGTNDKQSPDPKHKPVAPEVLNKLKELPADKAVKPVPLFGMEMPAIAYCNFLNLHSSHHRGQLSSYLRPMGAKVPAIYGGSADEPMQH